MTDRDVQDGGPAFPNEGQHNYTGGMTLRDYFAANVLPAVYADYVEAAQQTSFDEGWKMDVAIDAYSIADAMLKARGHA